MRRISDEEFEYCLRDANILGILHTSSRLFSKLIDTSERNQLQYIALWKALSTFDGRKGCSFLTYLYKYVRWECLSHLRKRDKRETIKSLDWFILRSDRHSNLLFHLNLDGQTLLIDRFFGNMTLEEMASKYKVGRETIRKRILVNLEELKNLV